MSDNYKTIARAHDIAKALDKDLNWGKTAIVKEIGITNPLFNDIMEMDPVSINIYAKSVDKLKAFIEKHEAVLDKPSNNPPGVHRSSRTDPFPVIPRKNEEPAPSNGWDPLADLDKLEKKLAARGYKLEARIIKINQ